MKRLIFLIKVMAASLAMLLLFSVCHLSEQMQGLAPAPPADTTVKFDFYSRPLPEIPLPNDIATRYDATSPTGLRINASMLASTKLEMRVRKLIDEMDGWGVFQPITIPFSGPLNVSSILKAHKDTTMNQEDDVVYLINVDRDSEEFGKAHYLDFGNGNYPVVLEKIDRYWKNDPRGWTLSLLYEEADEDTNKNGKLDPGEDLNGNGKLDEGEDLNDNGELDPPEDTDADGVLDTPNYLPGRNPKREDLAARSDALMTFYEKETNTLVIRPMVPLEERTTYALVVTRRLKDKNGKPVGSPFDFINHTSQTAALRPLPEVLPKGLSLQDIAFAFTFTTQSTKSIWKVVRDGLYGHGIQKHLGEEFPPKISGLEVLRAKVTKEGKESQFKDIKNPYILPTEDWFEGLKIIEGARDNEESKAFIESHRYIDYHVIGIFKAPQLFMRKDQDGKELGWNEQSWPNDLSTKPAPIREETIYFHLTVPRKEVSVRKDGKPAPLVILGHGYKGSRFEIMSMGGHFAKLGMATISIDCVSHGVSLKPADKILITSIAKNFDLESFAEAGLKNRAHDFNNDKQLDSGADFWTAYLFHTRDVVRQSALDYMQLVRIFKTFDGKTIMKGIDVNDDGVDELAGDFDGDGKIDVGYLKDDPDPAHNELYISMTGSSLGGIMSIMVGSLEPEITTVVPVSGGGGFNDIAIRSIQGGVPQAVELRMMGPLFVGTIDSKTDKMLIETIVPDLNKDKTFPVDELEGISSWDTMVIENIANGERGCGYVNEKGQVRAGIEADLKDPLVISFYKGPQLKNGDTKCGLREGVTPFVTVNKFKYQFTFHGEIWKKNASLKALAEGLGLRRANPEIRRFLSVAQFVLDSSDPAVYAAHLQKKPLYYPETKQSTGTHTLLVTTVGDMNVPASSGVTVGRSSGLVDYINVDPRYNKTPNQVLLDTYMAEAVHSYKRYTNPTGDGVHMDVDNFSGGKDIWGTDIPRLDPPLQVGFKEKDSLGGYSAALFPYSDPQGKHGFPFPGVMYDKALSKCQQENPGDKTVCVLKKGLDKCQKENQGKNKVCKVVETFDIGNFMFNLVAYFMRHRGKKLSLQPCFEHDNCEWKKPVPADRPKPVIYY